MLVASTYPLYPQNQRWSYPYLGAASQSAFSSEAAQGTYNATVAHLDQIGDSATPPRFLEYGHPFDPPGTFHADGNPAWLDMPRKPPIWISVVGNHGFYPVAAWRDLSEAGHGSARSSDEDYVYSHPAKKMEEYWGPGMSKADAEASFPTLWEKVRAGFRPSLQIFWQFLFWGLTLACLLVIGLNWAFYRWAVGSPGAPDTESLRIGPIPLDGPAQALNCRRVAASTGEGPCRGPGLLLAAALALLLMVYMTISWPAIEVAWQWPLSYFHVLDHESLIALVACVVIVLILVSLPLSLWAWAAHRLRRAGAAETPAVAGDEARLRRGPRWFAVALGLIGGAASRPSSSGSRSRS